MKVAVDKVRRLSLSEHELEKAATTNGTDVVRYLSNIPDDRCLKEVFIATVHVKIRSLVLIYAVDLPRFTQNNILRIYPKGTRITSSNYKPLVGWMHGAQMIAFNMQVWFIKHFISSNFLSLRRNSRVKRVYSLGTKSGLVFHWALNFLC